MWWFILTFILGMAVGRLKFAPAAILRRTNWFVWPSLTILLLSLGFQIGQRRDVFQHLLSIGWQGLILTLFAMLGSGVCAWFTHRYFFHQAEKNLRTEFEETTPSSEDNER